MGCHSDYLAYAPRTHDGTYDGESGVTESQFFLGELKARGIKLTIRAPQQHARYIERRGALLRHSMHVIKAQLKREGVSVSLATLLSEAVFAGNCLTFVGGVTPYQAVYGRQPAITAVVCGRRRFGPGRSTK